MNVLNKIFFIIILFFISSLVACDKSNSTTQEEHHEEEANAVALTEAQIKTAGIELGKIEQKQISGTIKVNGKLDVPPQQLVSVSVPFGGFLKSTPLLQGSRVQKGQLIAVIENSEYIQLQQDYLEAKNEFEFAKADYERQQQLSAENVNAQKTLQQAKATYQNWMAKKSGLQAKLRLLNIDLVNLENGNITSTANVYSTTNGYVTQVNVNIGRFVNPTDVLFEIVDPVHLHAELIIFEKDVPEIQLKQKVRFILANETVERTATVYLIGREISTDRTVRIHCHIDKEDKSLLPGMHLKAIVETGGANVSALPEDAIVDYQGKKYIFIPEKGKATESSEAGQLFKMVEVQIGNSVMGFTEIILPDGVETSTQVVVSGAYAILSKIKNAGDDDHH